MALARALALGVAVALVVPATASAGSAVPFVVTNTSDGGQGSLRQAILDANTSVGRDAIAFSIGASGTAWTILVAPGALPAITDPVDILGASQGATTQPLITIAPNATVAGGIGLEVDPGGATSTIDMLAIGGWEASGVRLDAAATVTRSRIGTNAAGMAANANGNGITVTSSGAVIGGAGASDGNVISGNTGPGVVLEGTSSGAVLKNNLIGTNAAGTAALANGTYGIHVDGSGHQIGAAGDGNTVSGNVNQGIRVAATAGAGIVIRANRVGTDLTGTTALTNQSGVVVDSAGVEVGGPDPADGNLLSGNSFHGLILNGGATGVVVRNNKIGTDTTGTTALGNGADGVNVNGSGHEIGRAGDGNLISGNSFSGVSVSGIGVSVVGNRIGTDATGTAAVPNSVGMTVGGDATVGGSGAGEGNLIAGNTGRGVFVGSGDGSVIRGNQIGTVAVPNGQEGVFVNSAANTAIGGSAAGAGNTIAGNGKGIAFDSVTGLTIDGNLITGNTGPGIDTTGPTGAVVGGLALNVITGNTGAGIRHMGVFDVVANSIYANAGAIDSLGNGILDPNDAGDATGPQNFPLLTSATADTDSVTVGGTLSSQPSATYKLRFFASGSGACDGNDAQYYLGTGTVTTDGSGNGSFSADVSGTGAGRVITAIAVGDAYGPSELSTTCFTAPALVPAPAPPAENPPAETPPAQTPPAETPPPAEPIRLGSTLRGLFFRIPARGLTADRRGFVTFLMRNDLERSFLMRAKLTTRTTAARTLTIASGPVTIRPGTRVKVRIRLNAKGRALLKRKRKLKVTITLTRGFPVPLKTTVTIRAPKRG